MQRKRISILLVLILLAQSVVVYADNNLENLQDELEQTYSQQKDLKTQINVTAKKQQQLLDELKKLDYKIDQTERELEDVQTEINRIEGNIKKTTDDLVLAEKTIDDQEGSLNGRLRVMYKNGAIGYFEVLLAANNFGDFLTRLDLVQKIIDHDVNLLKELKIQREVIKEKKDDLEDQQILLQATKQEVQRKKQDLEIATRSRQAKAKELEKDKYLLEKQYDQLNKEAKALSSEIRKLQSSGKYTGGKMAWPVKGYYKVTSPYGWRIHPIYKKKKFHTGVDLRAYYGTSILAATDGTVKLAGWLGGYGKAVIIDHGGGITTLYAHNSKLLVKVGDKVKRGQVITKAGSTGASTASHLHFEVRRNGDYENPLPWIMKK